MLDLAENNDSRCYMPGGKRRRASRSLEKTAVMHFRVMPLTLKAVKKAAAASGRTVSAECEHQLQRSLFEMGAPLYPILKRVCEALGNDPELSKSQRWAKDPELFNRALNMFNAALEMFRPVGSKRREATEQEKDLATAYVLDHLTEVAKVDESIPLTRQSQEQRSLLKSKEELRASGVEDVIRNAAAIWRTTQRLMVAPVKLSAEGRLIIDVTRVPKEENNK
jgi:hypothetical protein